jgi:hypothetical protein
LRGELLAQQELLPVVLRSMSALIRLEVFIEQRRERNIEAVALEIDAIDALRDARVIKANATELLHEIERAKRRIGFPLKCLAGLTALGVRTGPSLSALLGVSPTVKHGHTS